MYWYKRHIGDYHRKAGRLSMIEHGSYTLLIDSCYDRERFPTLDEAIEWTWARTSEEIDAVKFVLGKFFTLEDGVYVQKRILEEIEKYKDNSSTNARIAREREEKRRTNRARSVHEAPPNQEPITNNQEPKNQNKINVADAPERKKRDIDILLTRGVDEQVAKDYLAIRKAKKAPLTETALNSIAKEAEKANITLNDAITVCVIRSWQSFKASWDWQGTLSKAKPSEQKSEYHRPDGTFDMDKFLREH